MALAGFYGWHKKDWRDRSRKNCACGCHSASDGGCHSASDVGKNLHHHGTFQRYLYAEGRRIKYKVVRAYQEFTGYAAGGL
jgi:hypothetical protein